MCVCDHVHGGTPLSARGLASDHGPRVDPVIVGEQVSEVSDLRGKECGPVGQFGAQLHIYCQASLEGLAVVQ